MIEVTSFLFGCLFFWWRGRGELCNQYIFSPIKDTIKIFAA